MLYEPNSNAGEYRYNYNTKLNMLVQYMCAYNLGLLVAFGLQLLLGTLHGKQKNSTHTQDLPMEMHSYEREECVYVPS